MLLLNDGAGSFSIKKLPAYAQMAPILSLVKVDVNNDGFEDLVAIGNIFETEVETPRYDAGKGTVLVSNQRDGYTVLNAAQSGLYVDGNAKSLLSLKRSSNSKDLLIVGINDTALELFEEVD